MFNEPTTFVIGAGASCELDLPSGDGLKIEIIKLLKRTNDNMFGFQHPTMHEAMREIIHMESNPGFIMKPYWLAADRIIAGLPIAASIDNFLHAHQDDQYVKRLGKLAIAICILQAERKSHLFNKGYDIGVFSDQPQNINPSILNKNVQDTWYPAFVRLLLADVEKRNARDVFANLKFVIFNYDRCFEEYLWQALQAYFSINGEEAGDIVSKAHFIHPYGSLGLLPWQTQVSGRAISLGGGHVDSYWQVGDQLRTFTETVEDGIGIRIKEAIANAATIILLGFGFLKQNMLLLQPDTFETKAVRVMGTAHKVSLPDQAAILHQMHNLGETLIRQNDLYIDTGTCREFMDNHRLLLSHDRFG